MFTWRDVLAERVRPARELVVGAREPGALRDIDERLRTSTDWEYTAWGPVFDEP